MPCRVTARRHLFFAKVLFRRQCVVRSAAQRKVRGVTAAPLGEGLDVMELEKTCFMATLASGVDKSAAASVAFVHLTPWRRGCIDC
jgi:hypothetical protein